MNVKGPFKIEFEISSLCNAKCSLCMRTYMDSNKIPYLKGNISLKQLFFCFNRIDLKDSKIKLCGVLCDPISKTECVDICNLFILDKKVKSIEISTNGGTRSKSFWKELALLSKHSNEKLIVHWYIDGVTRNDYRENVDLKKVGTNFNTYYSYGGKCIWQYINFDYNVHEIDRAKEIAEKLDIPLKVRVSWKNTMKDAKFFSTESLNTFQYSFDELVQRVEKGEYNSSDIKCRHKAENELFVSSEGILWPCCHLHDEYVYNNSKILKKLKIKNDLNNNNFYDIINSEWFLKILEMSWDKTHPSHLSRCYLSCGDDGKRRVKK